MFNLPGLTEYDVAWRYQRVLLEHSCRQQKQGKAVPDALLLVEHPRVFTLGRGATTENLKFSPSSSSSLSSPRVVRVERGGEVTWHGPGQMVAYPILNLAHHRKDLHWYTNSLEETVIRALRQFGVEAGRNDVNTGVWIGPNKISAIGVTASRWHTMHGVSVNISNSLADFDLIVPCGIKNAGMHVCRLVDVLPLHLQHQHQHQHQQQQLLSSFRDHFVSSFAAVFGLQVEAVSGPVAAASLDALLLEHPDIKDQVAGIER